MIFMRLPRHYLISLLGLMVVNCNLAQTLGPIGPGQGSVDGTTIIGEFTQWNRQATPKLVLRPAGPGLKVFADIDASGRFVLDLPELTAETTFSGKGCGDPGQGQVSILNTIDLLTPLEGFGTPSDANQGLSVIGMAAFVDEVYANDIGVAGGKRLELFSSPTDRTLAAGECNNLNPIELKAGWTAVTQISGGSGGPHTYEQGVDPSLSWYWWAFKEPTASEVPSIETEPLPEATLVPATTELLTGQWNALEFDGKMDLSFNADGTAVFESSEGGGEVIEGSWTLTNGTASLQLDGVGELNIEVRDNASLKLFDASNNIALDFVRAGVAHRPILMLGFFEGSSGQGMTITLKANGQATVDFGFEDRPDVEGTWSLQDYQLLIESTSTSERLRYDILSMASIGFNLTGENLANEVVFFLKQ